MLRCRFGVIVVGLARCLLWKSDFVSTPGDAFEAVIGGLRQYSPRTPAFADIFMCLVIFNISYDIIDKNIYVMVHAVETSCLLHLETSLHFAEESVGASFH